MIEYEPLRRIGAGPPPAGFLPFLGRCQITNGGVAPTTDCAAVASTVCWATEISPSAPKSEQFPGTRNVRPFTERPSDTSLVVHTTWAPAAASARSAPDVVTAATGPAADQFPTSSPVVERIVSPEFGIWMVMPAMSRPVRAAQNARRFVRSGLVS